jgi:hypothetical protein
LQLKFALERSGHPMRSRSPRRPKTGAHGFLEACLRGWSNVLQRMRSRRERRPTHRATNRGAARQHSSAGCDCWWRCAPVDGRRAKPADPGRPRRGRERLLEPSGTWKAKRLGRAWGEAPGAVEPRATVAAACRPRATPRSRRAEAIGRQS